MANYLMGFWGLTLFPQFFKIKSARLTEVESKTQSSYHNIAILASLNIFRYEISDMVLLYFCFAAIFFIEPVLELLVVSHVFWLGSSILVHPAHFLMPQERLLL